MAGRDNFGSDMKSPGGWGGSGGNGMSGGPGGAKSSSNYNYYNNAGPRNPAIGNWDTGGDKVGFGNQYSVGGIGENKLGKSLNPGGLTTPVPPPLTPPVANPVVTALTRRRPPPVTQEDAPYTGALPGDPAPSVGDPWGQAYSGYRPGRAMGAGPQGTTAWRGNTTTVRPTGNVIKDQSRVPQPSWGDSGSFGYGGRR